MLKEEKNATPPSASNDSSSLAAPTNRPISASIGSQSSIKPATVSVSPSKPPAPSVAQPSVAQSMTLKVASIAVNQRHNSFSSSSNLAAQSIAVGEPAKIVVDPPAVSSPPPPAIDLQAIARDKALLKMIWINVTRTPSAAANPTISNNNDKLSESNNNNANTILFSLVSSLTKRLRCYEEQCPKDPDSYQLWIADRYDIEERVTEEERAAFELLLDFSYEAGVRHRSLLTPLYPLLLQNAYVLHSGHQDGRDMIIYIALALRIYDYRHRRDTLFREDDLISGIIHAHPSLRSAWSSVAFQWIIHSRDPKIVQLSLSLFTKLENNSLYFGDDQSVFIRLLLSVYRCLKEKRSDRLSSLLNVLLFPPSIGHDKGTWTSMIGLSSSLLCFSDIDKFSLGLSIAQSLFTNQSLSSSSISTDDSERKNWLLSLGRFLCKDYSQDLDQALIDLLFKGCLLTSTAPTTLSVLLSFSSAYAGSTLPLNNRLLLLSLLVCVVLRCNDIQIIEAEKKRNEGNGGATTILNDAASDAREREIVRAVTDCVDISLLLFSYAKIQRKPEEEAEEIAKDPTYDATSLDEKYRALLDLAFLFKQLAMSLSRSLPAADDDEGNDDNIISMLSPQERQSALRNRRRKILYQKMLSCFDAAQAIKKEEAEKRFGAGGGGDRERAVSVAFVLDGADIPSPHLFISTFFSAFIRLFPSRSSFDFSLDFFSSMLRSSSISGSWRAILFSMFGSFLFSSLTLFSLNRLPAPHRCDDHHFIALSDQLCISLFSNDPTESLLAENLSFLLAKHRDPNETDKKKTNIFLFFRQKKKPLLSSSNNNNSTKRFPLMDKNRSEEEELNDALQRIETHIFPILKTVAVKPRTLLRAGTGPSSIYSPRAGIKLKKSSKGNSAGGELTPTALTPTNSNNNNNNKESPLLSSVSASSDPLSSDNSIQEEDEKSSSETLNIIIDNDDTLEVGVGGMLRRKTTKRPDYQKKLDFHSLNEKMRGDRETAAQLKAAAQSKLLAEVETVVAVAGVPITNLIESINSNNNNSNTTTTNNNTNENNENKFTPPLPLPPPPQPSLSQIQAASIPNNNSDNEEKKGTNPFDEDEAENNNDNNNDNQDNHDSDVKDTSASDTIDDRKKEEEEVREILTSAAAQATPEPLSPINDDDENRLDTAIPINDLPNDSNDTNNNMSTDGIISDDTNNNNNNNPPITRTISTNPFDDFDDEKQTNFLDDEKKNNDDPTPPSTEETIPSASTDE